MKVLRSTLDNPSYCLLHLSLEHLMKKEIQQRKSTKHQHGHCVKAPKQTQLERTK